MPTTTKLSDSHLLDKSILEHLITLDDGQGFLETISSTFYADAEQLLSDIKDAIEANNYNDLLESIHALKGCASNLGAVSLKKLCIEYYSMAPTALMERRFEIVLELSAMLEISNHALAAFIKNQQSIRLTAGLEGKYM